MERWGTGALAIDACRIGRSVGDRTEYHRGEYSPSSIGYRGAPTVPYAPDPGGRFPANVLLDEDAAADLDARVGRRKSTPFRENVAEGAVLPFSKRTAGGYSDDGGPSRFFYTAKASKSEREAGCDHLPPKSAGEMTDREDGSVGLDSPRAGAGRGGGARNHHPTLKPIALTEYLARLLLPPQGGRIIVPYSGAGSEMIGAERAGWREIVGVERDPDYIRIAEARIQHHRKTKP